MATTLSSLMTTEPDRAHTLAEVHALVRLQAHSYLDCNPYQNPASDSSASFWTLMDRLLTKKTSPAPKPPPTKAPPGGGIEKETTAPRIRNTMTRLNFGHATAAAKAPKREKKHPGAIPIKGLRRRKKNEMGFFLDGEEDGTETRTERFRRRENERNDPRGVVVFPEVLPEEQLLELCSELTYRINCIKQATQYADELGVTEERPCVEAGAGIRLMIQRHSGRDRNNKKVQDCNGLNLKDEIQSRDNESDPRKKIQSCKEIDLNKWLTEELHQPGAEFNKRQIAFDMVQTHVEQAELFETSPTRRGKEEKAIKYVTIAVIVKRGWMEAQSGTSQGIANDIKTLAARRHVILRLNLYEPVYYPVCVEGNVTPQQQEDNKLRCTKSSQSTAAKRDNNRRMITAPIVMRGGFGK